MSLEIIVPGRFMEPKDPIDLRVRAEGWFTLSAVKNGRVVRQRSFRDDRNISSVGPFKNLILNVGMDNFTLTSWSAVIGYFSVGTGTTTPAVTQNALVSRVGNPFPVNSSTATNSGAPEYYTSRFFTALSAVGAFGTVNLTEIGIGNGNATSPTLFSRALIVDSNGNPVAFPISSDEQLQATYEVRLYPPLADGNFTVNVSGSRTVIVRGLNIAHTGYWGAGSHSDTARMGSGVVNSVSGLSTGFWAGDLGLITATTPQGTAITNSSADTAVNNAYSTGSYQQSCRWSWASPKAIGSLRTHGVRWGCCQFQVQYDPPLVKTSDQTLYLDYRLAWARR